MIKKIKFNYIILLFLLFAFSTLFGQKKVDYCALLEQVLTEAPLPEYYFFSRFDTIYIYEDDTIKYFANCDFSHTKTNKIFIIQNKIHLQYDTIYLDNATTNNFSNKMIIGTENPDVFLHQRCQILTVSVSVKRKNIEIDLHLGRKFDTKEPKKFSRLTYRKKRGKFVRIGYGVS
jgi:hypothetical protein